MATRPVTWELDVRPASLFGPPKKIGPVSEVPSLATLRASLTGTRFEFLKVSAFAACLVALIALALHGSRLANSDSQFAANAEAAARGLANSVYKRVASLRDATGALVDAASHPRPASMGHADALAAPARISTAQVSTAAHLNSVSRPHRKARAGRIAQPMVAPLQPRADAASLRFPASIFLSLVSPDALIAAIAALLLYTIFVVVFVRINGGMRALRGSHAV